MKHGNSRRASVAISNSSREPHAATLSLSPHCQRFWIGCCRRVTALPIDEAGPIDGDGLVLVPVPAERVDAVLAGDIDPYLAGPGWRR